MTAPRSSASDPEGVKRRALKLVAHAGARAATAADQRVGAWRYAAARGASLREIADADGTVSHMTIRRALEDD